MNYRRLGCQRAQNIPKSRMTLKKSTGTRSQWTTTGRGLAQVRSRESFRLPLRHNRTSYLPCRTATISATLPRPPPLRKKDKSSTFEVAQYNTTNGWDEEAIKMDLLRYDVR